MTPFQIAAAVLATLAVFVLIIKGVAAAGRARIAKVYRPEDIVLMDPGANCFGIQSKGPFQLRGNGGLVLTSREIHFFMLVPRRELRIPLGDIRDVKTVRSHLGKTVAQRLLHVSWTAGHGGEDTVAWWVRDVDAWKAKLAELRT